MINDVENIGTFSDKDLKMLKSNDEKADKHFIDFNGVIPKDSNDNAENNNET